MERKASDIKTLKEYRRLEDIKTIRPKEILTMHLAPRSLTSQAKAATAVYAQMFLALSFRKEYNRGKGMSTNVEMMAQSRFQKLISAE